MDDQGSCVAVNNEETSFGYTVLRFVVDNPGAFLFHCHIEWHMLAGLSMTWIATEPAGHHHHYGHESRMRFNWLDDDDVPHRPRQLVANPSQIEQTCRNFNTWQQMHIQPPIKG